MNQGDLLRVRNGVYLMPDCPQDVRDAATVGGRLTCVTELRRLGVFVLHSAEAVHVHVPRNASRLRSSSRQMRRHWLRLTRSPHPRACSVEPLDALAHAIRCLEVRASIAAIDSALHLGVVREDEMAELFAALPARFGILRTMIDGRAESGPESLVRIMLRRLGCRYELQVDIDGVGRVDLLVDGWLIIECDSEAHHAGWENRRRDLRRDQSAAALGYSTFRPIAEDIMWNPDDVWAALKGLVGRRRAAELRTN